MTDFSWKKLQPGQCGSDKWAIRVWDSPKDADTGDDHNYGGEVVTVTTRAGKRSDVTLSQCIGHDRKQRLYAIASAPEREESEPNSLTALAGPEVVPAGRYAYPVEVKVGPIQMGGGDDGSVDYEIEESWRFVHIWRGSRNPNVVRAYTVVAAGSDERGTQVDVKEALAAIMALGVGTSAQEFGWRTGHCGRCNTGMRVNLSRKLGMGPDCMKHLYENGTRLALMKDAREELRAQGIDPAADYDSLAGS